MVVNELTLDQAINFCDILSKAHNENDVLVQQINQAFLKTQKDHTGLLRSL